MKNLLLITGSKPRHAYYATQISNVFSLSGIVIEEKRDQVEKNKITSFIKKHQSNRERKENKYFGDFKFSNLNVTKKFVKSGEANSLEVFEWIKKRNPEIIFLYGSSIIKEPLLSLDSVFLNIHLGLSPYYKGAATNIWPLVNNQPECIGATFHIATNKVDAGPIIHQYRPELDIKDDIHDIGNKTILQSRDQLKIVKFCVKNKINQVIQSKVKNQKIYKKNDFNEESLKIAYKNISDGIIPKYLKEKKEKDQFFPLVNNNYATNS